MTYNPGPFNIKNSEGIDFYQTYTPYTSTTGVPEYPGLPFEVGTIAQGNEGSLWVFVTASSNCTAGQALGIEMDTWTAAPLTKAMADAGRMIGVCVTALTSASTSTGWVQLRGPANVTLKNSCLPAVPLFTTGSAGMLDDTSASQTRVYGIRSTDTATASGASKLCWIQGIVT